MKRILTAAALMLVATSPVFAWGREGHQAVGDVARTLLSKSARAHVIAILGNDDLGAVASWADEVRAAGRGGGPLANDPEAAQVNKDFPNNGNWHFVDLPLGSAGYDDAAKYGFTSNDDVVHAIDRSIAVLEGHPATSDTTMTKDEALKFIIHFVGDMHQPLHVCSGYYQVDADGTVHLVRDPATAKGLPSDRGGNSLAYGTDRGDEVHALWDTGLVEAYAGSQSATDVDTKITPLIDKKAWKDTGDYHQWAALWAGDTLKASSKVFDGLTFGKAEMEDGHLRGIAVTIDMTSYEASHEPIVGMQLAKASFRLAELLNAIWSK